MAHSKMTPEWPLGTDAEICVHRGAFTCTFDDVLKALEPHLPGEPQQRKAFFGHRPPRTISYMFLTRRKQYVGTVYAFSGVTVRAVFIDDPVINAAFDVASAAAAVDYQFALVNVYHLTDPEGESHPQKLSYHMDDERTIDRNAWITSVSCTAVSSFPRRLGWNKVADAKSGANGVVDLYHGDVAVGDFAHHNHALLPSKKGTPPCRQIVFTMRKMTRELDEPVKRGRELMVAREAPQKRQKPDPSRALVPVETATMPLQSTRAAGGCAQAIKQTVQAVVRSLGTSATYTEDTSCGTLVAQRGEHFVAVHLEPLLVQDNAGLWGKQDWWGQPFARRLADTLMHGPKV